MLKRFSMVGLILTLCVCASAQTDEDADMVKAIAAIKTERIDMLERLLQSRPSLRTATDSQYGATLLHWAAARKNAKAVNLLVERGAFLKATNNEGATPLQVAIVPNTGKPAGVDLLDLVKKLSDPEIVKIPSVDGKTALHLACQYNQIEIVKFLIQDMGANVNARTKTNKEPLDYALQTNNLEMINLLRTEKARRTPPPQTPPPPVTVPSPMISPSPIIAPSPITAPSPAPSSSPVSPQHPLTTQPSVTTQSPTYADATKALLDAAANGDLETVRLILQTNPKLIDSVNELKETPLHLAAKKGKLNVVVELIRKGANVDLKDTQHHTFWDFLICPPRAK